MTDRERIVAWYREERDRARETIRLAEEGGWTFHEARGNEPMRDVTAERVAQCRRTAERMEALIRVHEEGA